MTLRRWAVRIVYSVGVITVSLLLIAFLTVQTQQRLLRWRAERLLADMHQIRLYQTTWTDAQRLMHRWGAWGHYDGSCTAVNCKYEIEMGSIDYFTPRAPRPDWVYSLLRHDRLNLYQWFGGRGSVVKASFTVHDGTIWRENTAIGVSVPRRRLRRITGPDTVLVSDDFDEELSVGAKSYQRLHRTLENWMPFIADSEDELAQHPYYKVGRPGGCMINCQIEAVYYSTHTPPSEIERLTSYNFSCFTRFIPCKELEDLLPAAKDWHLYDDAYKSSPSGPKPGPFPPPCTNIPVWAQARDARYVLAVETLSTEIVKHHEDYGEYLQEVTKVRVVNSLKEPAPWLPGAIVSADHVYWLNDASRSGEGEHLVPGKRYIVFPIGNDQRDRLLTKESPVSFDRCGVLDDTPKTRRELEEGFAQNDALRP